MFQSYRFKLHRDAHAAAAHALRRQRIASLLELEQR
jgi:hypothetical protein